MGEQQSMEELQAGFEKLTAELAAARGVMDAARKTCKAIKARRAKLTVAMDAITAAQADKDRPATQTARM